MSGRVGIAILSAVVVLALALVVRSSHAEQAPLGFVLEDMNGAKVDLSTFKGKPLVINLWATWCGPCRLEMPQLVDLQAEFKERGLTIVGISVDDTADDIRKFAAEYKVTYPMLMGLGQDALLHALGYEETVPISILINADGTVASRVIGITTTDDWKKRIKELF